MSGSAGLRNLLRRWNVPEDQWGELFDEVRRLALVRVDVVSPPSPGCLCEAFDYGVNGKHCPIHEPHLGASE